LSVCCSFFFFFFSSRRRHTRFDCDWSSDVCSSDLIVVTVINDGIAWDPGRTWANEFDMTIICQRSAGDDRCPSDDRVPCDVAVTIADVVNDAFARVPAVVSIDVNILDERVSSERSPRGDASCNDGFGRLEDAIVVRVVQHRLTKVPVGVRVKVDELDEGVTFQDRVISRRGVHKSELAVEGKGGSHGDRLGSREGLGFHYWKLEDGKHADYQE